MRAVVTRHAWDYNDSAAHLPFQLRGSVPSHLKEDGVFTIPAGEEGYQVTKASPDLQWGWLIFVRENVCVHTAVPRSYYQLPPATPHNPHPGRVFQPLSVRLAAGGRRVGPSTQMTVSVDMSGAFFE
ncbi:hypothetical protein LRP88_06776 [Fusarium phalaenopsidis]